MPRWVVLILLLLTGCLSVELEPDAPNVAGHGMLLARIHYSGNPAYLPATVIEAGPERPDAPTVVYRTQTAYEHSSILHVLNPLLSFGYPGIAANVIVSGQLEVRNSASVTRRYDARCVVKLRRSLWRNGPSQTELRARGLAAVREQIEAQMVADAAALEALQGAVER